MQSGKDPFILDVRSMVRESIRNSHKDFRLDNTLLAGAHIEGVVHCPLVYLQDIVQDLPQNRHIIITDWIMKQSHAAAKFLISKGFSVLGILKGGTARWQAENFPLADEIDDWDDGLSCE